MRDRDVPGDDMTTHEFSDDDAEAIISGSASGEPELGAALDDLRFAFATIEPPVAAGALTEFIVRGADPAPVSAGAAAVPLVEPVVDSTPTRRHPVLASLSAFAGTALGKICIGASVAAASVGGATAAGVDTPISPLFDDDSAVVTEDSEPDTDLPEIDEPDEETEVVTETDDDAPALDPTSDDDDVDDADEADDADDADDADEADESDSDDADESDAYDEGYEDGYDDASDDDSDNGNESDRDDDSDDSDDSDDTDDSDSDDDSDDNDDSDSDDSDDTDDSDSDDSAATGSATVTHNVDGVGSVAFAYANGVWTLNGTTPAGGWSVDEAYIDGDGVDVRFVNGPIEVDVDAEIEDGQIRVRVRTENDDTDEESETFTSYPLS